MLTFLLTVEDLALGREHKATRSQAIWPMVFRKRLRESEKRTAPIKTRASICGHTTLRPAPRKRIAWEADTKCVVGAACMMASTNEGMLSIGVMPPDNIW